MVFYQYTLIKMLKSISTYITAAASLLIIWIITLQEVTKGSFSESTVSMTAYLTFPIMIIFLTFKVSQIFRDEIENKTLLTIQAKPITRKQMIFQGLLAASTLNFVLAFVGGLLPFLIGAIPLGMGDGGAGGAILHGFLIMITEILLLTVIAVLALWISLSMGGKAFVGTMIGGFVAGFYVLFVIALFITLSGSRHEKLSNAYNRAQNYSSKNPLSSASINVSLQSISGAIDDTGTIYTMEVSNPDAISDALMNEFINNHKPTYSSVIAWINPVNHWTKMFMATNTSAPTEIGKTMEIWSVLNEDAYAEVSSVVTDGSASNHITKIVFKQKQVDLIPTWYPYVLWIVIAGISIPLIVRSLQRKNIA